MTAIESGSGVQRRDDGATSDQRQAGIARLTIPLAAMGSQVTVEGLREAV